MHDLHTAEIYSPGVFLLLTASMGLPSFTSIPRKTDIG